MSRLVRFLQWYRLCMRKYPLTMNSVQSGLLTTAGDVVAQTLMEGKSSNLYDSMRTARMATIGLLQGPIVTIWFRRLESLFGTEMKMRTAVSKVILTEFLFAPLGVGSILLIDATLEEKSPKKLMEEKFLNMLIANYVYWPIASYAVFRWVPAYLRPPVTSVLGLGWTTFISWCINNDLIQE